jgi:hypothetical protein
MIVGFELEDGEQLIMCGALGSDSNEVEQHLKRRRREHQVGVAGFNYENGWITTERDG